MMSKFVLKYKAIILAGTFILLLSVAYLLRHPQILNTGKKQDLLFPGFNQEGIEKIKITSPGGIGETVLVKKDKQWLVETKNNFPADQTKVKELLETTANLKPDNLVSRNKNKHVNFQVDSQGIVVVFQQGKNEQKLIIGKRGPTMTSSYFRREDEDNVFLSEIDLTSIYTPFEWRDISLKIKNTAESITSLKIENSHGKFELVKKNDKWVMQLQSKKELPKTRVEDLLSKLLMLEAQDATISAETEKTGLARPEIKITLKGDKGEETVLIGKENENALRYTQISGSQYFYLLSAGEIGTFEDLDEDYFTI